MRFRSHYGYFSPENYRVMKSFKYNGQKKKEEDPRSAWRAHKHIEKDKSKAGRWQRKWKSHFKNENKRRHRSMERKVLAAEKFDKLHRLSYKTSCDPWAWD